MSEVSNVGPIGSNGGGTPKKRTAAKKETPEINAFDAYKQFKQQAEAEYKEYQNNVKKEYAEFRNKVIQDYNNFREQSIQEFNDLKDDDIKTYNEKYAEALENPDNWKEYQMQEGIKPPIMNKPKTAPVYNPENEEGGQYVKAQVQAPPIVDKPKTAPVYHPEPADSPEASPAADTSSEKLEVPVQKKGEAHKVARQGASGSYTISEGKNGNGFELNHQMQVRMLGEARKFFSPGFGEIKRDENGYYSYRGIKSKNYNVVTQKVQSTSIEVSANNAIYNDLLSKKNSGKELTKAEKNFMDYHIKNLAIHNLAVDKDGNLTDISNK